MLRIVIILFCLMISSSVLAGTLSEMTAGSQWLLGLNAGPTWVTGNKTQTINLQADIEKTYTANNSGSVFPSAELFMGLQKPLFAPFLGQPLLGQLSIVFAAAGNAELEGDIWEDADPEFNNFTYKYKVQHTHIAIAGRLVGNCHRMLEPYISASVGLGFNRAFNFRVYPNIAEEVAAPPFNSDSTTTLSYTLGIGLQKSFNSHVQAAIGYEFADWGKIKLARAAGQTLNQGLTLNHLYAHQLQLSLFYII